MADNKKRVTLPTQPGERFELQAVGNDKFILTRLLPVKARPSSVKLRKKEGFTAVVIGRVRSEPKQRTRKKP